MPGQPEDEAHLLKKARQGEAEAFGVLYEQHAAAIFRYLLVRLNNRIDAEDLTSDVFLRAWQALPRYQLRGFPFRAFLFRIAHNALVDHYRHQKSHRQRYLENEDPLDDEHPEPAEIMLAKTDQQELFSVLSNLKEDYQTVLILRFINALSPGETAKVMQRSPGAVRVLQHRALEALRKTIDLKGSDER